MSFTSLTTVYTPLSQFHLSMVHVIVLMPLTRVAGCCGALTSPLTFYNLLSTILSQSHALPLGQQCLSDMLVCMCGPILAHMVVIVGAIL